MSDLLTASQADGDSRSKAPPNDPLAEASVLGAILLENEAINPALEILTADDFYRESHRAIFNAMVELSDRSQPIDAITLSDALRGRGLLETVGGPAYLAELAATTPTAANVAYYAGIVRERAVLRKLASVASEIAAAAYETPRDVGDFLERAEQKIVEACRRRNGREPLGTCARDIAPQAVPWLWAGRIPGGKPTIVEGDPGLGKSLLTIDMAARVSTGRAWPDGSACAPGNVLVVTAEDDAADTVVPRLRAAQADLSRIFVQGASLEGNGEGTLVTLPEHVSLLEASIQAHGASLVVLDPLTAFLSAKIDSHRDHDVRRALAALAGMAERTGAAVVVVRHLNKSGGANSTYRGGGSIGILAASRAAFLLAPDPEDRGRRVLACVKLNLAPMPPSVSFRLGADEFNTVRVEWCEKSTQYTAADLLAAAAETGGRPGPKPEKLDAAQTLIADLLKDGAEHPSADLKAAADKAGISHGTLMQARKALGVRARKPGFAGKWVVWLNPDFDPSQPSGDKSDSSAKSLRERDLTKSRNLDSSTGNAKSQSLEESEEEVFEV